MRKLRREEVVAMWLFSDAYANSGLSAFGWHAQLTPSQKATVADFILQYERARRVEEKMNIGLREPPRAGTQGERP